jgi:hypothetical protein
MSAKATYALEKTARHRLEFNHSQSLTCEPPQKRRSTEVSSFNGGLLAPLAKQRRTNEMIYTTIRLGQTEEQILNYEVSDDALETAGRTGKEKAVYTVPSAIICLPFVRAASALSSKRT